LTIDGYSADFSKYPWEPWSDWGWRSVVSSISDLICKGARPVGVLVSIGLERGTDVSVLEEIYHGISEALDEYGLYLIGGDTNASSERGWISVASIGFAASKPIPRSGAEVGDYVYTTLKNGGYGLSCLVWRIYSQAGVDPRSVLGEGAKLRPRVPIEFLELLREVKVTASIDVSDGLSKSLHLVAAASRKAIVLERLPSLPSAEHEEAAAKYGVDPAECVLYGGEEYETVFTSPDGPGKVLEACEKLGLKCMLLGRVVGEGPAVKLADGSEVEYGGYDQFKSEA